MDLVSLFMLTMAVFAETVNIFFGFPFHDRLKNKPKKRLTLKIRIGALMTVLRKIDKCQNKVKKCEGIYNVI